MKKIYIIVLSLLLFIGVIPPHTYADVFTSGNIKDNGRSGGGLGASYSGGDNENWVCLQNKSKRFSYTIKLSLCSSIPFRYSYSNKFS